MPDGVGVVVRAAAVRGARIDVERVSAAIRAAKVPVRERFAIALLCSLRCGVGVVHRRPWAPVANARRDDAAVRRGGGVDWGEHGHEVQTVLQHRVLLGFVHPLRLQDILQLPRIVPGRGG